MLSPAARFYPPPLSLNAVSAVILFHGCGGPRPLARRYCEAANAAGLCAVTIDSFTARGIGPARAAATVCTGLELPGGERAGDVLAAVWGVAKSPGIDPSRILLAGWSHGGWSIMDLMTMPLERSGEAGLADPDPAVLTGVSGLFLAYPYCGFPARTSRLGWRRTPRVQAILGERDVLARSHVSKRALAAAQKSGADVSYELAPGATHAFDDDRQPRLSPYRYSPAASARSLELFTHALAHRP